MSLTPGQNLGNYRIIEQIGRGGMATVFKAFQPALNRYVAIKVLPAFFSEDPSFSERFRQEAIAVASLRHPNILAVHDYGEEEGVAYIVTELVEGGTLADQLGKALPLDYCVDMLRPVASALDYAHSRGVVHRDVKPSNVLLARDGTPILSDFGLARMAGNAGRLTATGTTVGTPEYMAPEQATNGEAGPSADIYALAVVAYEMLTGTVPFAAETPLAVVLAHLHNPLPLPRERNPDLPEAVEAVLLRGLAKEPEQRYKTAGELIRGFALAVGATATFSRAPAVASERQPSIVADGAATAPPTTSDALPAPSVGQTPTARFGARSLALIGGLLAAVLLASVGFTVTRGRGGSLASQPLSPPSAAVSRAAASAPSTQKPASKEAQASAPAATPSVKAAPRVSLAPAAKLLRADDFSDPAKGLFLNNQQGVLRQTFKNGASGEVQWQYGYADGGLVVHLKGPYPANQENSWFGPWIQATDKMLTDFAVEVRARAMRSPGQAAYQVVYILVPGNPGAPPDAYSFSVRPGTREYSINWSKEHRTLAYGRSSAVAQDGAENLLRMEVRGDSMRVLVNGQEVDKAQHEGLARRPGSIAVGAAMTGPPSEGDVDVRFQGFNVYSLSASGS